MAAKVTFDSATKIITVTQAPDVDGFVDLDVKADLYSDGKEEWLADATLNKFRFFMQAIGGQEKPGGYVGTTFFLKYGWKLRPYEASHTLRISGNLYTDDGSSPVVPTVGAYTVLAQVDVSAIVEAVSAAADIKAQADQALLDYDGPTRAEATADKNEVIAAVPAALESTAGDVRRIRRHQTNRLETDPLTGVVTLYDDDGATPLETADLFEDVAGAQPYRGSGAERRDGFS